MALGRKTGGRKKGVKNKRTLAVAANVADARRRIGEALGDEAFSGDAHALLIAVYSDPNMPTDLRLEAARAAIPYEKPRLSSVELGNKDGEPLVVKILRFSDA